MSREAQSLVEAERKEKDEEVAPTSSPRHAAFVTSDGCVFEVADASGDLGRATAFASESSLSRVWGDIEEDKLCRIFREAT